MGTYKTPGVYTEEISTLPPSVAEVSTAIPAFIGYTEKCGDDVKNKPIRISSLLDFEHKFGGAKVASFKVHLDTDDNITSIETTQPKYQLYYHLRMFFLNGGGNCYIVSVGDFNTGPAKGEFLDGLNELAKEDEPTLNLFPEAVGLTSENDYYDLCVQSLAQCAKLKDRFTILDVLDGDTDAGKFRTGIGTDNLKYGAAYYPYLNTTQHYLLAEADEPHVSVVKKSQAKAGETGQAKAGETGQTEAGETGQTEADKASTSAVKAGQPITLDKIRKQDTALYNQVKAALDREYMTLPPSSAVAGVYSRVDREKGVWKAPANESLASVIGPAVKITNDAQRDFNVHSTGKSINAIRAFSGKGTLIWGARTLEGNSNEWRYVSIRRLFNMIEESINKATAFAVFGGNDAMDWLRIKTMIESYLEGLWRKGALAGSKPEEAYTVNVGLGRTMTEQDILNGIMNVEVGIAAVRPAEFIILKFSHKLQEAA